MHTAQVGMIGQRKLWLISPMAHRAGHYWENTQKLCRHLSLSGYEVHIACYQAPATPAQADAPTPTVHSVSTPLKVLLRLVVWPERWRYALGSLLVAVAHIAGKRGIAVHYTDGPLTLFAAATLLRLLRGVSTMPGVAAPNSGTARGRLRALLIRRAAKLGLMRVVCENQRVAQSWATLCGDVGVTVIPYFLDNVRGPLPRSEARRRLGLSEHDLVVLLFGTHREDKDYDTVVRAASVITPRPTLMFIGKVVSDNDPAKVCSAAGYDRHFIVDDFVPNEEIPTYFGAADVTVLPYPFGLARGSGVLLEACGYLCPLVVTSGGSIEDFVRHFDVGEVYVDGSPTSLVEALLTATSPERAIVIRDHMAAAAKMHSGSTVVNKYIHELLPYF
jgi:glycosyltransferase involved in cell wall biosynthesis